MSVHLEKEGKAKCGARSCWGYGTYLATANVPANCKRCLGQVKQRYLPAPIEGDWKGKIFHRSYGYDMTINEYAVVIEQSEKSVLVQECSMSVIDDNGRGGGKSWPCGASPSGKKFRLFHKVFVGEKPHSSWAGDGHSWSVWDGQLNYYNSWD